MFRSAAIGTLAALCLLGSSGTSYAVRASPPTCNLNRPCAVCTEYERGGRCVKCHISALCIRQHMKQRQQPPTCRSLLTFGEPLRQVRHRARDSGSVLRGFLGQPERPEPSRLVL